MADLVTTDLFVTIERGRSKGRRLRVIQIFGKQSLATEFGVVLRSSLSWQSQRNVRCAEADVTWEWLTETMTSAEAEAWLGMR